MSGDAIPGKAWSMCRGNVDHNLHLQDPERSHRRTPFFSSPQGTEPWGGGGCSARRRHIKGYQPPGCSVTPSGGGEERYGYIHSNSNSPPVSAFPLRGWSQANPWHCSGVVPASLMRFGAMECDFVASPLGRSSALFLCTIPSPHDKDSASDGAGGGGKFPRRDSRWGCISLSRIGSIFLATIRKHCMAGYHRLPSLPRQLAQFLHVLTALSFPPEPTIFPSAAQSTA